MKITLNNIKNPILKRFFKEKKYKLRYEEYLRTEDPLYITQLEDSFKEYYYKVRILNYFNTYLHFKAIKHDIKYRKLQQRFQLILDRSIEGGNNTFLDNIEDEKSQINIDEMDISLYDFVKNERLSNAINKLTNQQKKVLYFYYMKEMKDIEIANELNVTRQSISKTRSTAIKKLRKDFDV
ncbi:sigma-70 family RNA polymerase sigma factor [Chengkuizengella sediminis]|uniref:sigma-70 family RNA polymerase sigma factor n=1 Tax=Chengkuizengella sediminis TaxID=1885917 RepID=UPI001389FF37|nr:sigma-70 family RNA polymerase sigma factor [Chengkuizengella sediminis]NDI35182.1 sigma-70 family RNA polymerase sigma factor [Chengkuizengella sediminis]